MPKTLFDHVTHITQHQTPDYYVSLDATDKKTFTVFMINRFLSMDVTYLPIINQLQPYLGVLPDATWYTLYRTLLPRRKVYLKYIKATEKTKAHPEWAVALLARVYNVSVDEADEYMRIIMTHPDHIAAFHEFARGYGIAPNIYKKLK